jgi:hypothetical protein
MEKYFPIALGRCSSSFMVWDVEGTNIEFRIVVDPKHFRNKQYSSSMIRKEERDNTPSYFRGIWLLLASGGRITREKV